MAERAAGAVRRGSLVLLVVAGAVLGAGTLAAAQTTTSGTGATAPANPLAETDASIARLRQEADAQAARYFDALATFAEVQRRIDDIEARLPALTARADALRDDTRARAVAAYKRAGGPLRSLADVEGPMQAARRVQWLDRLNARDDAAMADLHAATDRLGARRAELRTTRESAASALDEVRERGAQIDALLAAAQARRATEVAAAISTPPPLATDSVTTTPPAPSSTPGAPPPTTTTTTMPRSTPPTAPPTYAPTPGVHAHHDDPFLACTRARESSGNYAAYNPAGPYMGAYQFLQATWNGAANHAGRTDLIGVPPHTASQFDQDDVAWALYQWQGSRPWGGMCDGG